MTDVQINKAVTDLNGLNSIHLVFFTNNPEPLLDAIQETVKSTVNEHARDESYSHIINIVIALTPVIKDNQDTLEEQLNGMLPFFNEQFSEMDAGPKPGTPFKLIYILEEDEPVTTTEEIISNETHIKNPKPWWKLW